MKCGEPVRCDTYMSQWVHKKLEEE
jgi:hypothetical protein